MSNLSLTRGVMIGTRERVLPGLVKKLLSIFWLANAFSTYMNTVNFS